VGSGSYSGSFDVPVGVSFYGAGIEVDRDPNPALAAGTPPTITASPGIAAVTLHGASKLKGILIAPASDPGTPGIVVTGSMGPSGAAIIANVEVRKHAPGIAITDAVGSVNISATTIADTAGDAVAVSCSGAFTTNTVFTDLTLGPTRSG